MIISKSYNALQLLTGEVEYKFVFFLKIIFRSDFKFLLLGGGGGGGGGQGEASNPIAN